MEWSEVMHASIHFARQLASRIFISLQEIQVNDHIDNFSERYYLEAHVLLDSVRAICVMLYNAYLWPCIFDHSLNIHTSECITHEATLIYILLLRKVSVHVCFMPTHIIYNTVDLHIGRIDINIDIDQHISSTSWAIFSEQIISVYGK